MARINFEDSIYKDRRFYDLIPKCHSILEAKGLLLTAWELAQAFFLNEETNRMIPVEEWQKQKLGNALLEVGYAKQVDNYIYVCGSKEQFAWLLECQEAGRRGGRPKSNKTTEEKGYPIPTLKVPKPLTPTLPLSLPLPLKKNTNTSTVLENSSPPPAASKDFVSFESEEALILAIPRHKHDQWAKLYSSQDFITREIKKAFYWYCDNPKKLPKTLRGWSMALSSWLERSWARERNNGNTKPRQTKTMYVVPE